MICDNGVEDGNDLDDEVDDDGGDDVHPEQHQQRQQDPCAGKLWGGDAFEVWRTVEASDHHSADPDMRNQLYFRRNL